MEVADDGVRILQEESDDDLKINIEETPTVDDRSNHDTSNNPIQIEDGDSDSGIIDPDRLSEGASQDEKKKAGLSTVYDGFQIYGRILCLVVKRKDGTKGKQLFGSGKGMVEEWISSTQANENDRFE